MYDHLMGGRTEEDRIVVNADGVPTEMHIVDRKDNKRVEKSFELLNKTFRIRMHLLRQMHKEFIRYGTATTYLQPLVRRTRESVQKRTIVVDDMQDDAPIFRRAPVGPKKEIREKRVRMDEKKLVDQIFELFKQQPEWTLQGINLKLDQPELFLKKKLEEFCDMTQHSNGMRVYTLKKHHL